MILSYGGREATDVFSGFHAASTWRELKHFHIGHLTVRRICCVLGAWERSAGTCCVPSFEDVLELRSASTCCELEVLVLALCSIELSASAWPMCWSSSPATSCHRLSQRLQHLCPEAWRGSHNL